MSVKIMDINDLSDSREVMAKKVPPATTVFICFVAMMLIAVFIWAYFGKIDTYVIAAGEIRSAETPSTITLRNGGKIANIIIADGAFVHEGDTIIELDKDYYENQQSLLDEQIAKKESDIANYQQLIKSLPQCQVMNSNYFENLALTHKAARDNVMCLDYNDR